MSKQQQARMLVDPATGETKPYPSHAAQWREYHGSTAWLWNPWTAERRHASDVGSDPFGYLIAPPGEPVFAEPPSTEAKEGEWRPIDGNTPTDRMLLGIVDGAVRFIKWGKTSHVPLHGWCLADQGVEDFDLCEPTAWMPVPDPSRYVKVADQ